MSVTDFASRPRPLVLALPIGTEPILSRIGLAMVLSLLLTVPAFLLDGRVFQGESVWIKPIKFQIALAVYLLTLAVFASWLPARVTRSPRMRWYLTCVSIAVVAEMLWIGGAAMFATASHYNPLPVMYAIYVLMGAAAVLLTSVSVVFGIAFWRDAGSGLPPALRLSLALGLILTFVLTVPAAGTLSALPGHFIGTPVSGATLPLMGWSREVGDLRVAHFLATHALHAVPLMGLVAVAVTNATLARRLVWVAAVAYAALTLFTFLQALGGQPFL